MTNTFKLTKTVKGSLKSEKEKLICPHCNKKLKIGDTITKTSQKYYHKKCYQETLPHV